MICDLGLASGTEEEDQKPRNSKDVAKLQQTVESFQTKMEAMQDEMNTMKKTLLNQQQQLDLHPHLDQRPQHMSLPDHLLKVFWSPFAR